MNTEVQNDLRWLATSPSLVAQGAFDCPTLDSLAQVVPSAEELAGALQAKHADHLRLGIYFEDLVELQLRHTPGVSDVRRGTVIREDRRTLGELDFLFTNGAGLTEHWEVAVKFYLFHRDQNANPDLCFLGPRTVDRLDRKVKRMRDHQLKLPSTPAAKEALGTEQPIQSKALVRGRLFYPLHMEWSACRVDQISSPDHLRGWWAPRKDLSRIPEAQHYLVIRKRDWLTCPNPSPTWTLHTLDSLALHLDQGPLHPVQILGLDENQRELHRGFVVPDAWPHSSDH